ncbi:hypothetical protein PQ469_24830 [Mucilaginibacter sp. KACC 22773]|uniref:hypothetical protein n=1 Tax=Mucilaginibacter sp. KACC 22773 TaxID=3025671 RepID=UPI00236666BE|nr:hypothetical protein [Mucilaginibacter sp. KACC 22773]WDF77114.1 hypothetical protein PQ469_24830 [Mucilaginibacter sp. KACC 22773]
MAKKCPQNKQPDFSSLSGIMEHFSRVPFEQFKLDLDEWFGKSLEGKGIDLCKLNGQDTTGFPEQLKAFVDCIYRKAEISGQNESET